MKAREVHIICDCQRHALRERTLWRRSVRLTRATARNIKRGGATLVIGVSLAFGAIGIPSEAMDAMKMPSSFRIFTTPTVRREFLTPSPAPKTLTPDVSREQFFKAEIPFGSIIYREALRNHLQPELVAAVVEAESDFRARLISEKNAQGLMQIVPSTGRILGAGNLLNPEENVAAGTKYLRYLMNRFEDPSVAIAAYNAGEGNVERFKGVPPFPETLNYLRKVSSRTRAYRERVRESYFLTARVQTMYVH